MVIGGKQVEKLNGQAFLLTQIRAARGYQARDVLIGYGVVLARLHARLAFAELSASDPDQLENPSSEEGLLSPGSARRVGHENLLGAVGEDLKRDRGGVGAVCDALFDYLSRLRRELVQRNRFDPRHSTPISGFVGV